MTVGGLMRLFLLGHGCNRACLGFVLGQVVSANSCGALFNLGVPAAAQRFRCPSRSGMVRLAAAPRWRVLNSSLMAITPGF